MPATSRRKLTPVVLGILGLGIVGAVIVILGPNTNDPVESALSAGAEGESSQTLATEPQASAKQERRETPVSREVPVALVDPEADASQKGLAETVEVQVVVAKSGEPIPDLVVHWLDRDLLTPSQHMTRIFALKHDSDAAMSTLGRTYTTDAEGIVRVQRPRRRADVTAWTDRLWGTVSISSDATKRQQLELKEDMSLLVRVIDGNGVPLVGVPVELCFVDEDERYGRLQSAITTPPSGIAHLRHSQHHVRMVENGRMAVTLDIISSEEVEAPVDPMDLPTEPITIVMPPTGSVMVQVAQFSEVPFPNSLYVELAHRSLYVNPQRGQIRTPCKYEEQQVENGLALFTFVSLGLDLRAGLYGDEVGQSHKDVPGPLTPGQQVIVHMRPGPRAPVLVGRAVDEGSVPLASQRLLERMLVVWASGREMTSSGSIWTDQNGVFRTRLDGSAEHRTIEINLTPEYREELHASIRLTGPLAEGENAVGDIVFTRTTGVDDHR